MFSPAQILNILMDIHESEGGGNLFRMISAWNLTPFYV